MYHRNQTERKLKRRNKDSGNSLKSVYEYMNCDKSVFGKIKNIGLFLLTFPKFSLPNKTK